MGFVGMAMFQVVPTEYHTSSGRVTDTNQYSATDHMRKLDSRGGQGLPGKAVCN